MLRSPDPVVLPLPAPSAVAPRAGVPIVATIAPVVLAVAIWAVTQSVLSLLFAGLGPVVALAGLLDTRRHRRRERRAEGERTAAALERLATRIDAAHDAERARRIALVPPDPGVSAPAELGRWAAGRWRHGLRPGEPLPVRLGTGVAPAVVRLEGDELPVDEPPGTEAVRARAAVLPDAPLVVDAADGIGIVGPLPAAAAVARALALQLAARLPPAGVTVTAPGGEDWIAGLPHEHRAGADAVIRIDAGGDVGELVIAWARDETALPPGCAAVFELGGPDRAHGVSRGRAWELVAELSTAAELAAAAGGGAPPDEVALAELLAGVPTRRPGSASLAAVIGRDGAGPVGVDLVADGPHALVGGTTGSGKSELLVSWVLAMAAGRTPAEVAFLLVDFKGGAAFAPLSGMPHVVGILSDLDARLTRRAIESLRAELLRRERLLAEAGARSIGELPAGALPRLVVVVDEFAAVVAGQPELHEVFGDLAARGRSLGLHLVLCTQRPAGVVRDGVLANVTLRIGLRMTDRGDSVALLGDDAAARLPAAARGRAVLTVDGVARPFQVALAAAADLARATATAGAPAGGGARPWLDPLPEVLPRAALGPAIAEAIPFGLVDLPAEQRQPVAVHRPAHDGHLLVLGAARAGRTSTLAVLAQAPRSAVLPGDPADAWQVLAAHLDAPAGAPRLLVADDLDLLLGRAAPDDRHELGELLARLLREGPARGVGVVAAAQRVAGPLQPLAPLFGSRLLLRLPSREEHVLAGGAGPEFDPALPPGAGRWHGAAVQVAWEGGRGLPPAPLPALPIAAPTPGRPLAIVAARPAPLATAARAAGRRVAMVGEAPAASADVLLGDPDAWQADWTTLQRARRELPIAFVGVSPGELRTLTRRRDALPPLGSRPGECWLLDADPDAGADVVRRAVLRWTAEGRDLPDA